jgi:hypothetical protein
VHPSRYAALFRVGFFLACVAKEENRYRDKKGVISKLPAGVKNGHTGQLWMKAVVKDSGGLMIHLS